MNKPLALKLLFLFTIGSSMPACASKPYPVSDHCDGEKFFMPGGVADINKGLLDVLKWKFEGGKKDWPAHVDNTAKPQIAVSVPQGEVHITFINHATHLIQFAGGLNVLTDPVYSERVSPFTFAGPKRVREPGVAFDALPHIDVVVISHNHYDHTDLATLKRLSEKFKPLILVPLGERKLLVNDGITNVEEYDWWQKRDVGDGAAVTFVPAQHWSARGLFDRNEALWGGWVFEAGGFKLLFTGDSGYGPHFKQIHEKFGAIDVAIIPIGAYEPRWFMRQQHMNPDDAVLAHLDLESHLSLGSHFGCFELTDEAIDDPPKDLGVAREKHGVAKASFEAPDVGETVVYRR